MIAAIFEYDRIIDRRPSGREGDFRGGGKSGGLDEFFDEFFGKVVVGRLFLCCVAFQNPTREGVASAGHVLFGREEVIACVVEGDFDVFLRNSVAAEVDGVFDRRR